MGRVFLARSPGGRQVAVKVIHPELARDPGFRRRFRREMAAIGCVSGAFTAPLIDGDPDADPPWMASAYVSGPALLEVVAASGPMPPESAFRLGAALAEALTSIHAAGVIHRDLKPASLWASS